jgi:hypothetical protein
LFTLKQDNCTDVQKQRDFIIWIHQKYINLMLR